MLTRCRKISSSGLDPAIVLGEFYEVAMKKAGRDAAEKAFVEITGSRPSFSDITPPIAKQADALRAKYNEKVPWGDCIIAAAAMLHDADYIVTENHHFKGIGGVKARTLH